MASPYQSAFEGNMSGMPMRKKNKRMDNYFSSEDVLGNADAQNTAQRGKSASSGMQEAYDSLMNSKFMDGFTKMADWQKTHKQEGVYEEPKYPVGKIIFAGGYHEVNPDGTLKTEMSEISRKMNSGELLGLSGFSGGKMTSGKQKSYHPSAFEEEQSILAGTKAGVATMGTSDDRTRWLAQSQNQEDARLAAEAEAKKKKPTQ